MGSGGTNTPLVAAVRWRGCSRRVIAVDVESGFTQRTRKSCLCARFARACVLAQSSRHDGFGLCMFVALWDRSWELVRSGNPCLSRLLLVVVDLRAGCLPFWSVSTHGARHH